MRERAMVPEPQFESYYGRPILKEPTWKQPDIPVYLFVGGYAGTSAVLAAAAEATGRPALARVGRIGAAAGAAIGTAALIHDLGRPGRFLNMLRVVKVTSPLSVGSWILAPFATLASAAAASELTGVLPRVGRAAGLGAAALGAPLATYTAALISNTAIPAWHDAYREMPFLFAGSAAGAAAGMGLVGSPVDQAGPARRLAVVGAAAELLAQKQMERRLGMVGEPYGQGRPGRLLRAGSVLGVAGAIGAVAGSRSRVVSALSGGALVVGSLLSRFGVFQAGLESARDPKYTVVPQRERAAQHAVTGAPAPAPLP